MPSSKLSVAELRAIAQPPSLLARRNAEHWAGRLYMRRLSPYVTWALLRTGLSANAVTLGMMLVGVAGAYSFKYGTVFGAIVGAVLIQLYLLLDCSDGEMARATNTTGATGIFLDRLGHFVVETSIIVATTIAVATPRSGVESATCFGPGNLENCVPASGWSIGWLFVGFAAALTHLLAKLQTDLVEVARAKAGLAPLADDEETAVPRGGVLRTLRRLAGMLPLFRVLQAVEASILVLVATIVDRVRDDTFTLRDDTFTSRALLVVFLVAAVYEFVGHLVGILASNRLRA